MTLKLYMSCARGDDTMDAYTSFAEVYDIFMDNVPYQNWADDIRKILTKFDINEGLILELGCGTGSLTQELAKSGYDMIGVDNSGEMLDIAMEKRESSNLDILYLCQDMREFELYGTVRAVISICDSINYILEKEELLEVFKLVNNYLDPGGIFLFDLNTIYKYENLLADNSFSENREDSSFIWDNYYDADTKINEYELTLFVKEKDSLYRKYEEMHYQRAYSVDEIQSMIESAGMEFVGVFEAFTQEEPKNHSERIYFIAREKGKKNE